MCHWHQALFSVAEAPLGAVTASSLCWCEATSFAYLGLRMFCCSHILSAFRRFQLPPDMFDWVQVRAPAAPLRMFTDLSLTHSSIVLVVCQGSVTVGRWTLAQSEDPSALDWFSSLVAGVSTWPPHHEAQMVQLIFWNNLLYFWSSVTLTIRFLWRYETTLPRVLVRTVMTIRL